MRWIESSRQDPTMSFGTCSYCRPCCPCCFVVQVALLYSVGNSRGERYKKQLSRRCSPTDQRQNADDEGKRRKQRPNNNQMANFDANDTSLFILNPSEVMNIRNLPSSHICSLFGHDSIQRIFGRGGDHHPMPQIIFGKRTGGSEREKSSSFSASSQTTSGDATLKPTYFPRVFSFRIIIPNPKTSCFLSHTNPPSRLRENSFQSLVPVKTALLHHPKQSR